MAAITVLIADAQVLVAEALATALRGCEGLEVIDDHPTSGTGAVEAAVRHKPDVALLDYWLEGMDGPAVVRSIRAQAEDTLVVHLSWFHGPAQIQEALDAGVAGFLPKSVHLSQVEEAVRRVVEGEHPVFAEELDRLVRTIQHRATISNGLAERLQRLTTREIEILKLLNAGYTVEGLAGRLGIAQVTARTHIQNILKKTDARSQLQAVAMARDIGLLP